MHAPPSPAVAAVFEPVQTATTFEETVERLGTAIRLGLLTPGEVRALWSQAMARGLYDGWDAEREGPPPGPPPATREAKDPALGREG